MHEVRIQWQTTASIYLFTNTNNALYFLNRFAPTIAALLESTVDQLERPQKVHAQGEQNMFEDNPNLNNTNLENNIFIIFHSLQHFSKHSLTQTTPFIFSIASLLQ